LLFSNSAFAGEMKETLCEAESSIIPYLKILTNLLHGEKNALDKMQQILWHNNEHSMYYDQLFFKVWFKGTPRNFMRGYF